MMAAAVVIGTLLLAATGFVRQTIHDASDLVVQGMGGMLIRSTYESIRRWDARSGPHTVANRTILERLLRRHTDDGLRYIAIVDDEARIIVEAGEASLQGVPDEQGDVLRHGRRARLVRRIPPMLPAPPITISQALPDSIADALPDPIIPMSRADALPYSVVFEFEPIAARDLEARGQTLLLAAILACAGIIALAFLFAQALVQRERLQSELEEKRRLATLGEMSAVLAHELRNPLASLKGHAQLLSEYLEPDDKLFSKANRVVGDAIRLEQRMNDLLAFARSGELESSAVDPNEPLEAAVRAVGEENVEVAYLAPIRHWTLDSGRMQQALENVLLNAVQANPPGKRVVASVAVENGRLCYRVRDFGDGISPADAERIFEPFVTSRTRGVGLGLAVTRRIVELHGGRVAVRSPAEGGAEFSFVIPGVS